MDVGLNYLVCDYSSRSPNVLISYSRCPETTPDPDHFKLNCWPELFQATQVVRMWTANLIKATLWGYILKGCSPSPSWLTAISLLDNGGLFLVHSRCNLGVSGDTLTNWTTQPGQSFCLLPEVFVPAPMSISFGRFGLKSPARTVYLRIFPLKNFRFLCFIEFMHNHGYVIWFLVQNDFTVLRIFILLLSVSLSVLILVFLKFHVLSH